MQRYSFLIIFTTSIFQPLYALDRIDELMWDSRIILVRALVESEETLKIFRELDYEIYDRDIYWFVFKEKGIETNYKSKIEESFRSETLKTYFSDTETNVVLIGKDGYIKQKLKYLDLQEIFDLIDTMPMRQLEMREKN